MAGETTVIHLPFAGGIDEKIAKEYLDASSRQASVLNGDFVKLGTIDKRNGLAHLPTTLIAGGTLPTLATGTRVVGWSRSSLSVLCSTGLYQYVSAPVGGATTGGVVGVGKLPNVVVRRRPSVVSDGARRPAVCDVSYGEKTLRLSVFDDYDGNILASVADADTGDIILEPTLIYTTPSSTTIASVFDLPGVANGNPRTMIVLWDSDLTVRYIQYNPSTNSFTSATTLVSTPCNVLDVAPYEDDPSNGWLLVYDVGGAVGTPGGTVRLAYWTASGLQTTVDQTIAAGNTLTYGAYVCGRYGQSVWTLWSTLDGLSTMYYWAQSRTADTAFGSPSSPNAFDSRSSSSGSGPMSGCVHLGTTSIFVTYQYTSVTHSPGPNTVMGAWRILKTTASVVSSISRGRIPLGLVPMAKPFVVDGDIYQPFFYDLNFSGSTNHSKQVSVYLCKFEGVQSLDGGGTLVTVLTDVCRPVATVAPRQVSTRFEYLLTSILAHGQIGFVSTTTRSATRVAVGLRTLGPIDFGDAAYSLQPAPMGPAWAADFFWDEASRLELYQASELGGSLSISGGVPFVADGQSVFEDSFFNYPEFSYASTTGTGTTLPSGSYTFAVIYRAVDASGAVHRSAPYICSPVSVTTGGAYPVVTITPPIASYRDASSVVSVTSSYASSARGKVFADVYMTVNDGSTLYYSGSVPVTNISTLTFGTPSWPTGVDYTPSDLPDTTGPLLYTTGGVMDNVNPPASKIQITHQGRKAIVDETLRAVWFSKQFAEGEASGFNETLYVSFPEGGDITALGSFEGKFFAFKARSIWLMSGEGPAVTGLGASWTTPEPLTTDVGCKKDAWQSVVGTPNGLMFQAPNNGIYLLGRDLQVSFVGKNVIDQTTSYPNIVSATLVPLSTQVRFICLDSARTNHIVIVYDYLLDTWTTHQYGQLSSAPVSSCLSFGSTPQYTVLSSDGNLWQERLSTDSYRYLDEDSSGTTHFVSTVIRVPYVKLQTQGFHRARRVQFFGEQQDDCGLQMQFSFNYDDTVRQTATWSSNQLRALSTRGQVEAYVSNAYNKQMSMQLTISDTAGASMTNGAGMRFVSTAIELQNLGPRYKLLSAGARR